MDGSPMTVTLGLQESHWDTSRRCKLSPRQRGGVAVENMFLSLGHCVILQVFRILLGCMAQVASNIWLIMVM